MRKRIHSLRFTFVMVMAVSMSPAGCPRGALGAQISVRPEPAPERVLAGLRNSNASTRRETADQLGALRARNAVRPLIDTLRDKDAGVREAAAFALGQIANPAAVEGLTRLANDKDADTRSAAVFALGMIGERKSATVIADALDDP